MQEWTLTTRPPDRGSEFVRSRHFPESAQGNFLFNNIIGFQGIKQYKTVEDGSGFVGVEVEPLLQSTDPNFRPVAMQFGPDGALYVVDWFNPLVGHMQYSMRDPRRDKTHGRVWRITAKGRPLLAPPVIDGATIAQQLDLLKAYEDRTRYQARLALRDRPTAEVLPAVQRWIDGLDHGGSGATSTTCSKRCGSTSTTTPSNLPLLKRLLAAKEFRARAAAVRVLQHWFDRVDGAMALLAPMVRDEAPRVRLEAVRALSFVPTAAAAEAALRRPRQADGLLPALRPRLDDDHAGAGVEAAAHERRAVRRGQPGRPGLRARTPRAGRAGVGEAQRSGLRGDGVAPRGRPGAAP